MAEKHGPNKRAPASFFLVLKSPEAQGRVRQWVFSLVFKFWPIDLVVRWHFFTKPKNSKIAKEKRNIVLTDRDELTQHKYILWPSRFRWYLYGHMDMVLVKYHRYKHIGMSWHRLVSGIGCVVPLVCKNCSIGVVFCLSYYRFMKTVKYLKFSKSLGVVVCVCVYYQFLIISLNCSQWLKNKLYNG